MILYCYKLDIDKYLNTFLIKLSKTIVSRVLFIIAYFCFTLKEKVGTYLKNVDT